MIKILILAISLSYASDNSVETIESNDVVMIISDYATFNDILRFEFVEQSNCLAVGEKKAWQPKESRAFSQIGGNNTKIRARLA